MVTLAAHSRYVEYTRKAQGNLPFLFLFTITIMYSVLLWIFITQLAKHHNHFCKWGFTVLGMTGHLLQATIIALLSVPDIGHIYEYMISFAPFLTYKIILSLLVWNSSDTSVTWKHGEFGIPMTTTNGGEFYQWSKATPTWYVWLANSTIN